MNLKFPFSSEQRKMLPIHPYIIFLLLLFSVSSVRILKVKSLFVYSGQELVALSLSRSSHVKLSSEAVYCRFIKTARKYSPFVNLSLFSSLLYLYISNSELDAKQVFV